MEKRGGLREYDAGEDSVVHSAFYRAQARRGVGRETTGEVRF
jgi:hypothetical protein